MAAYHELYVHLVWATFDRLPLIDGRIEKRFHAVLAAKCDKLGCRATAIGGIEDHIHVLVQLTPVISVSDLVRNVIGVSSHFMNREVSLDHAFRWQHGYGAFTVSKRSIGRVAEYVLGQQDHHSEGTLVQALENVGGETAKT